jgi:hypothetical protein
LYQGKYIIDIDIMLAITWLAGSRIHNLVNGHELECHLVK